MSRVRRVGVATHHSFAACLAHSKNPHAARHETNPTAHADGCGFPNNFAAKTR